MAVKNKTIKKTTKKVKTTTKKKFTQVGFLPRLVAVLIDTVVLAIAGGLLRKSVPFMGRNWVQTLIGALYFVFLWVNWNGQTVGKKAMGIKVVRVDGKPLDYPEAITRYLMYIVSAIPFFLGYFWVIWDEKKQGWHDKVAKTFVVKE
ncbi:RDD family protein [Patescibacteria group bacterium]